MHTSLMKHKQVQLIFPFYAKEMS